MNDLAAIRETVGRLMPETERFLADLIRLPSMPGREEEVMNFLADAFGKIEAGVEKVPLSNTLRNDPDYSDPIPDLMYDGRFNLRMVKPGAGRGRRVLLNTHVDVVPPSEEMVEPWTPTVREGALWGRGACDAKGQVATIYLVFYAMEALGWRPGGDVIAHLVVEEENGGNGTLAMVRRGEQADVCIVLEPSDNVVFTSIRGAVWFRLTLKGKAGHSGQAGQTRSALLMARDAMAVLERYHAELLAASRGLPLFDAHPNPMPLTFGRLQSGNWPASAPSQAVLEGVLGFLPNRTHEQVAHGMAQALKTCGNGLLADHADLTFMYRHDSSVLNPNHDLPQGLLRAAQICGRSLTVGAMTASCDAWFYNNQLGIPTVVYGPGTLKVAHSKDEHIGLHAIAEAAEHLLVFLQTRNGANP